MPLRPPGDVPPDRAVPTSSGGPCRAMPVSPRSLMDFPSLGGAVSRETFTPGSRNTCGAWERAGGAPPSPEPGPRHPPPLRPPKARPAPGSPEGAPPAHPQRSALRTALQPHRSSPSRPAETRLQLPSTKRLFTPPGRHKAGAPGSRRHTAPSPAMAHTLPAAAPLQHWGDRGPADPLGYSSSSPAASPDSCGLASPAAARGPCRGHAAARPRGRKGLRAAGAAGLPRQSASEREKLRMRRLAQALLRLRHYLPPALAPAGQTLTKIETLRLATRYIAHLSALLGLGRGTPAPRHCPLCPRGLGCCQDTDPRDASPPGAAGWGSPPVAGTLPELRGAPGTGTGAWGSPLCSPAAGTAPGLLGAPEMGLETWGSPPYIPAAGALPGLSKAVTSTASPWLTPPHSAGAGAPPDLPGDVLDMGLVLSEFVGTGTVTQDLSADLLSLLEALFPPEH
ncbi:uncharacterized protein FYW23_008220 [Sylvia borin]